MQIQHLTFDDLIEANDDELVARIIETHLTEVSAQSAIMVGINLIISGFASIPCEGCREALAEHIIVALTYGCSNAPSVEEVQKLQTARQGPKH